MLIITGTKRKKKQKGWVAEVCAFCRDVKACRFIEVRAVGHLYYVSLGAGKVLEYELECGTCRQSWGVELDEFDEVLDEFPESLEFLIQQTNPDVLDDLEHWLEIQESCQSGGGTSEERREVIFMVLMGINSPVQRKVKSVGIDGRVWGWILLMMLLPLPLLIAGMIGLTLQWSNGWCQSMIYGAIATALVCGGFCLLSLRGRVARFIRKQYSNHLIESLMLIEPTRAELRVVLTRLKKQDIPVGKYLRLDWLYEDLLAAGMPEPPRTPDSQ